MAMGGPGGHREARLRVCMAVAVAIAVAAGAGCGDDSPTNGGFGEVARPGPKAPNVVVVMTDDQDVASMAQMPIVGREIADRGVSFSNSFVGLSECCPSRATFLTGQHAHNHGVESARPPEGGYAALDSTNTLAVWLDEAGYRTGEVGRYLNYYGNPNVGNEPREIPPGWDDWHVPVRHTDFQVYDYLLNENGQLNRYGHAPSDYSTDVEAEKAVQFIGDSAKQEDPFFLWVTPSVPHSELVLVDKPDAPRNPRPAPRDLGKLADLPFPEPPSFAEIDESDKPNVVRHQEGGVVAGAPPNDQLKASFLGRTESLLAVDRMVGEIVDELRRTSELRRTYVIFTSDNGYLLGEHRQVGKHLVFEESIRVPLAIRGPGLPAGVERSGMVQNIDLAPTIVDLTGAQPQRQMDGVSLLPEAIEGDADPDRHLLVEYLESKAQFSAVRSPDGYAYAENKDGSKELYDLNQDPYELVNVADDPDYAEVQARLAERLDSLRDCAGSDCR